MTMRKTSVYLDDEQARRLARLAGQEGRSQAEILRAAVAAYPLSAEPHRSPSTSCLPPICHQT